MSKCRLASRMTASLHPDGAAEGGKHEGFAFAHAVEREQGLVIGDGAVDAAQLQLFAYTPLEHGKSRIPRALFGKAVCPGSIAKPVLSFHILPLFLKEKHTNVQVPLCAVKYR